MFAEMMKSKQKGKEAPVSSVVVDERGDEVDEEVLKLRVCRTAQPLSTFLCSLLIPLARAFAVLPPLPATHT